MSLIYNTDANGGGTGEGVVVTVTIDGVPTVFSCAVNGIDSVIIPPGALSVTVAGVFGCNGGAVPTFASYSISGS